MKRIVICCDGTWNGPRDTTTVSKMRDAIVVTPQQPPPYYDAGVGTFVGERILGGIFGKGISRDIRQAYRHLAQTYEDGDRVYLFGYSRGAFAVRSLGGFIRKVGLLRQGDLWAIDEGYDIYRQDDGPDSASALAFRAKYRTRHIEGIDIEVLGVWDTVGSLGVPVVGLRSYLSKSWRFHDYNLSVYVKRAYQALAIDEHHAALLPALWTVTVETTPERRVMRMPQTIEQTWFPGAHHDIGGTQANRAFTWLAERARAAGLELDPAVLQKYVVPD